MSLKNRRNIFFTLIVVSGFVGTVYAQASVDSLTRVAWFIQDQRIDADGRLAALLSDRSPDVRVAAFRTVANLRDTVWGNAVMTGLRDQIPAVRRMAAFASGQLTRRSMAPALLRLAEAERSADVRNEMLDAFGRIGGEAELDSLVDRWTRSPVLSRTSAMSAFIRFSIRGVRTPRAIWFAVECLGDRQIDVRWKAMYALGRWAPHPAIATEIATQRDRFIRSSIDRSADVRMNAAILLGKIDSDAARDLLKRSSVEESGRKDSDWRVRVQIVRAAAAQLRRDPAMVWLLISGLQDPNDHVVIASAMALPSDASVFRELEGRDSLRSMLWNLATLGSSRAPMVGGESVVALLRLMPENISTVLQYWNTNDLSSRQVAKFLEAISQAPVQEGWHLLQKYWDDERAVVAMAAWDNSRRFFRHPELRTWVSGDAADELVHIRMSRALSRGDMGISTVVSTLLADSSVIAFLDQGGHRIAIAESLAAAVDRMKVPDDVETLQAALQTLGTLGGARAQRSIEGQLSSVDRSVADAASAALTKLTGTPPAGMARPRAGPDHTDYDWELIQAIVKRPRVELITDRGKVVLQLLPEAAPFTSVSFVRLVRSGYFHGLTFHRVVPNFVVQGGDPRGDGWGGPGYALRTESSPLSYERGTVGMASAGFDTEGSQFFITHVATPHLNARYTIFARVTEGIEVVDRLQVGDAMKEIRVQALETQRGARSR